MGLTFKNIHCGTLGLDVADKRIPLMAEPDVSFVEVPGKNGAIPIPNSDAPKFKDMEIEVDFHILPNGQTFHDQCRSIANWLADIKKNALVFDDDAGYTYNAIVTNQVNKEQIARFGEFTVIFRCDPIEVSV